MKPMKFAKGDRVRYEPDPGVRPFIGTVIDLKRGERGPHGVIVEWDADDYAFDDGEERRSSIMLERQLEPLSVVDRLAELA